MEEAQLEVVPYSITIGYLHLSADHVLKVRARQVSFEVMVWTEVMGFCSTCSLTWCSALIDNVRFMLSWSLVSTDAGVLITSSRAPRHVCQQRCRLVRKLPFCLGVS